MYAIKKATVYNCAAKPVTRWARYFVVIFCGLSLATMTSSSWAQRYKSLCDKALRRGEAAVLRTAVSRAVKDPSGFGQAESDVNKYLKHYFYKMTCSDPAELGELGKRREDFFKLYIRPAKSEDSKRKLTQFAYKAARSFAIDNYHPSVRYNATLILGDLDSKYASKETPPVPLQEATAVLLDLLEKDAIEDKAGKDVKVLSSVKTGALVGLERHARFGVDARHSERLTNVVKSFLDQKERPEAMSKEVDHWLKCQALAVLVQHQKKQPTAELQSRIIAIADDEKFSLEDRCYAVELMALASYENAEQIDGPATLESLAKLSREVLDQEAIQAEEFRETKLAQGGGFQGRRRGGSRYSRDQEEDQYERRPLLSRLRSIQRGAKSVAVAVPEDTKAKLTELLSTIEELVDLAAKEKPNEFALVELVQETKPAVDSLVEGWGVGGAPGEGVETDDF